MDAMKFVKMKSDLVDVKLCIIKIFPLYKYHTGFQITTANFLAESLMAHFEEVEDEVA